MQVSVPVEALMVVLFFILSTIFICVCTCNSESIWNIFVQLKNLIFSQHNEKTPSNIHAYVPTYKRNWTPNIEEDEDTIPCARHALPVWLQASSNIPKELYSSVYSFKNLHHQFSADTNGQVCGNTIVCYVSSV